MCPENSWVFLESDGRLCHLQLSQVPQSIDMRDMLSQKIYILCLPLRREVSFAWRDHLRTDPVQMTRCMMSLPTFVPPVNVRFMLFLSSPWSPPGHCACRCPTLDHHMSKRTESQIVQDCVLVDCIFSFLNKNVVTHVGGMNDINGIDFVKLQYVCDRNDGEVSSTQSF